MAGTALALSKLTALDDIMIAMDVVDTLRHRDDLVRRELSDEARESELIARLRQVYRDQGIEVPNHVLADGVKALNDSRFVYTPPPEAGSAPCSRCGPSRRRMASVDSGFTPSGETRLMWTGRQTLVSIESTIAKLHGEEGQLDQTLRSAVSDADRLRKERSQGLRELARIKLDEMTAGRFVRNLDAGERRAMQILDDYRMRLTATTEQREALLKEVAGAEAERNTVAVEVEAALEAVETLRLQAEAKVQTTPEWRAAKTMRDEADAVATEAERKAAGAEAELGAKKKPYDDDPLFAYLWRRDFGTSAYKAGGIASAIDRIVADFIDFSSARRNYKALIEIPLRLREHATARRAAVAEPHAVLSDIERQALLELNIDTKERTLAEARHRLAVVDDTVDRKHGVLSKLDETRKALVTGEANPAYNEALETIAAADTKDDLATLYSEARRTTTTADEAIVRGLEVIDAKSAKVEAEIAGLRRTAQELSRRRLEVEQVRDRFRTTGFDHPQATFQNNGAIADTLKSVLEGAVRSGALWDLLRGGYGSRPTRGGADFGSGSFPFPFPSPGGKATGSTGGSWRDPSSRGGWSPGGNKDFSTGGSF